MTQTHEIPNLIITDDGHLIGGQPTPEALRAVAGTGIKNVVNLRAPTELDWDEGEAAAKAGLGYVSIPVTGVEDLSEEAVASLRSALDHGPTFVHCGSGNRVGALFAVMAFQDGANAEDAIEFGEAHGLTALREALERRFT